MKNQKLKTQQSSEQDDYAEYVYRTREEKMRNKRKERRVEHALRTRNIDELMEVEDDWEE
jgi:hypothetical protein